MSKIIEAKAVISAEDRTGKVLDGIARKFRNVGKGAKITAEVDRLNRSLAQTEKGLRNVERMNAAKAKLDAARLSQFGAEAEAARVKTALDRAKRTEDARAVADLTAQHRAAERAVTASTQAVRRQEQAVEGARRELNAMGVPITNLVAHERALKASVENTTAALRAQGREQRELTRNAEAKALRRQRLQEAEARAARTPPPSRGSDRASAAPGRRERTLGPLAGAVGAFEVANAYKQAAAFDRRMTMIGQTADADREKIDGLSASVHDLAQQTATPVDKLAGGLEALVAQGRSLKEAMDFLPSVARTAAASGSEVDDIAKTADSVGSNFEVAGRQMQKAFDIMAAGGKAGQFELKDMARYLPSLGPAASAIGFKGEKGLSDLVSMLQVMRKGSGTAEEAVASMNNILAKMESDKTTKAFKTLGVDSEAAFKKARKEGRNLVEVFEELVDKALKGDRSRLGEIIDDMEFKRGVQALMTYRGEWQKLSRTLQENSGGTVMRDLVQVTKDAQASVDRLSNSWARFTQGAARFGDALGASSDLGKLGKEFEEIGQALERINKAYAEGGLSGAIKQVVGDSGDRVRENRRAWLEQNKSQDDARIAEMEAENQRIRERLAAKGHSKESIDKTLMVREEALAIFRRRAAAAERALQDPSLHPKMPLRMGVDPTAPLQGQVGEVGPGVAGFQQAYPLDLERRRPITGPVPEPPRRPAEAGRGIDRVQDVLGPGGTRGTGTFTGDAPEVTVKPKFDFSAIETAMPTIEPKVETADLDRLKASADQTKAQLEAVGATTVAPQVQTGPIDTALAKARELLTVLGQIGTAASSANTAIGTIRARSSPRSFSDGVTPGAGGP